MAKKEKSDLKISSHEDEGEKEKKANPNTIADKLKEGKGEIAKRVEVVKKILDDFSHKLLTKFDKYVLGVCLIPPLHERGDATNNSSGIGDKKPQQELFDVLVLIDDSDSKKMRKEELKERLERIIKGIGKEVSDQLNPQVIILSELWAMCFDGKYDYLEKIAKGVIVYDRGMLSAIKIAEVHKTLVLSKFEKYIVSYVLAGSLIQGRATKKSDVDVFVVVDDTDVKRMTRAELKDKLRAIIIGMGFDAAQMTGIKNKLNIQVYILTEFWDSLREANPVIFTLLRDGVPFYDRGLFTPWKQLLKMGRIKPSQEAIDMFLSSGEKVLERAKRKLTDIAIEDLYYALLTPSQASLMSYGMAPPTPRETVELMRDIFVKKEKMLEDGYVDTLAWVIKLRKDVEHGDKPNVSGKEIDELLKKGDEYLKRINKLFEQIQARKEKESMEELIDNTIALARELILDELEIEKVEDSQLLDLYNEHLIKTNKMSPSTFKFLKEIMDIKNKNKVLSKTEMQRIRKRALAFIRLARERLERKRARKIDSYKIKIKYAKEKIGFIVICEDKVFISKDITNAEELWLYSYKNEKLGEKKRAKREEMEECIEKSKKRKGLSSQMLTLLKEEFGNEFEILPS